MRASALRAFLRHVAGYDNIAALIAVVGRNPVPPPDLPGDAPVTDILKPMQIDLVKTLRHKLKVAILDRLDGRLRKFFHPYEPLLLNHRLHRRMAAVMGTHIMRMLNYLYQVSLLLQILNHYLSCFITFHSCVLAAIFIDGGIVIHHIDLRKVMALAHLEVVRVMSRRNLNRACTKFLVYIIIRYDRNLPVHQRKDCLLAYQVFVTFIIRMYRDRGIAQHRLGTGGGYFQTGIAAYDRILNVPEVSVLLFMLYLRIRERSLAHRTPVDDSGSSVNISFFVKFDEHFLYCLGASLIHGKALSVPVAGYA